MRDEFAALQTGLVTAWLELFNYGRHWRRPSDWMNDLEWSMNIGLITDFERQVINRQIWSGTNYGVVRF